jgi:hypothetical protein
MQAFVSRAKPGYFGGSLPVQGTQLISAFNDRLSSWTQNEIPVFGVCPTQGMVIFWRFLWEFSATQCTESHPIQNERRQSRKTDIDTPPIP